MNLEVVVSHLCYCNRMAETLRVLLVLGSLLVAVERSEGVRCFANFSTASGECDTEIGEVNEDDCCQNPHYGYKAPDGECQFCGPPVWSPWSSWSPCNTLCGDGVRQRTRKCFGIDKLGCKDIKDNLQMEPCSGNCCDVQGTWSDWSNWGECSSSCIPQGQLPTRTRHRVCPGPCDQTCQGEASQVEDCSHLPPCPETGTWGSWSAYSSCPVTCGVGLQVSSRTCDNPDPEHGDSSCPGEGRRTKICHTNLHCPVDGVWSEWSEWNACRSPMDERDIRCRQIGGTQTRDRTCLHQAHNGSICSGGQLVEMRVCYDVDHCFNLKGTWNGWGQWSFCKPPCGDKSRRFRFRNCKPDYSEYRPTIGRQHESATFFGTPKPDCGPVPDGERKYEIQSCVNAPPC